MKRDFLKIKDLKREEIFKIFELTEYYKREKRGEILKNRIIGLLFSKPSTRTRISFEVAVIQLGGHPIYIPAEKTQIGRGETIKDTSMVLSRYLDGLVIRTYSHKEIEEYARWSSIPIINGLTDLYHPCQALSDYFTILEKKGSLENIKITYIGDANNVCNSLILGADILGVEIRVVCPKDYSPSSEIIESMENRNLLKISHNPGDFIEDADVIYTDTWVSMGQEKEREKKISIFKDFQVNKEMLKNAKKDFIFMHCMPAHRGEEVSDEIMDGENSVVFEQAENRLHCQKALLHFLFSV